MSSLRGLHRESARVLTILDSRCSERSSFPYPTTRLLWRLVFGFRCSFEDADRSALRTSRVLPRQNVVRVNSPRNVASLSAKSEPKQLKRGPKEAPQVTEGDVDAAISGEVVSKGQFAALRNVSPGRVSQWISEGKIKPDALVGEGRNAKINVAVATRQLRVALDVGQLTGNGVRTRRDLSLPVQPMPAPPAREPAPSSPGDPIADAIKQERLDQLRRANRR